MRLRRKLRKGEQRRGRPAGALADPCLLARVAPSLPCMRDESRGLRIPAPGCITGTCSCAGMALLPTRRRPPAPSIRTRVWLHCMPAASRQCGETLAPSMACPGCIIAACTIAGWAHFLFPREVSLDRAARPFCAESASHTAAAKQSTRQQALIHSCCSFHHTVAVASHGSSRAPPPLPPPPATQWT